MLAPLPLFTLLFATALVVSSIGFIRLVWFISIGYGYAIAAMAIGLFHRGLRRYASGNRFGVRA